jgi:5-methylcytosine-specific restriction protein A
MAWGSKSRHERGYGAAWVKLRARVLQRDCGLCQVCKRAGRVTIATQVDHIVSKANATRLKWTPAQIDHENNCQSICGPCHLAKTEEEQGKTKHKPVRIGVDGFPIEE